MSSIPEDLYQEILLRVPVKPLLVCKCVCKNWYDLISSSDFVKLHLEFTAQKNNPSLMIDCGFKVLKSIGYDSLASSSVGEIEDSAVEMDYPFKYLNYNVQLAGSCNGLFCLRIGRAVDRGRFFCLWNPATKECKQIPKSPACRFYSLCALGYDRKTDNYKLVVAETVPDDKSLVQVFTVASNSWKPAQNVPFGFYYLMQKHGVLANGELHWLTITAAENTFSLHSLDMSEENFKELQMPPINRRSCSRMTLGVLEGHLCVLVDSYVNGIKIHLEIWEMLNYGVQESWTRRYIITHQSIIMNDVTSTSPVWCFQNGKILFTSSGSLVMYDPKRRSAVKLNNHDNFASLAVNYFESLVSLGSGTYAGREGGMEQLRET